MNEVRVFLVDDHAIMREGLRALIEIQEDMLVVGEAAAGDVAVEAVLSALPDVVVMDISMPGLSGAEATRRIKEQLPEVGILALTAHEDTEYVRESINAGATGFLFKRAAAAELITAIRAVADDRTYLNTTMSARPLSPITRTSAPAAPHVALSDREGEVLRLIALGYAMKRIAADLQLSPRTLETYKARAMEKLGLTNRADIVRFAVQQGWLNEG